MNAANANDPATTSNTVADDLALYVAVRARRVEMVRFTRAALAEILACVGCAPTGAEVIGLTYQPEIDAYEAGIAHPSFRPVFEGGCAPLSSAWPAPMTRADLVEAFEKAAARIRAEIAAANG